MFYKSLTIPRIKFIFIMVLWVIFSLQSFSQTTIINSGWKFTLDSTKTNWKTVNIPHTWNKDDAFDDERGYYRGKGWYQKQVFISDKQKDKIHYLKFNAVNQEASVYLNGKLVGNHKGGYTAFNFEITQYINYGSYNLIEVSVDNSHNENIPPLDADFTFYGGIYRDVELISLPKQHISLNDFTSDGFYVDYYKVTNEKGGTEITVLIDNFDTFSTSNQVQLSLFDADGKLLQSKTENLKIKGNSEEKIKIKLPEIDDPNLWSPESPYLYNLTISLKNSKGILLDEKKSHVAFRWVSVDPNNGFFLNGKPYKMIGVNRHQDYQGYGNAVPMQLQRKDIHLIKEMGANVIRFGHYPHSRELYKLCDELGILVWSEIPIVNKVTNTPEFFVTSLKMQKEHLKQYYNFPSIVMFGYMNEIFLRMQFDKDDTVESREAMKSYTYDLAKQLEDLTREIAPNRLTVMALHFNEIYSETGIADLSMLIGWNLYFGWYNGVISDLGDFLDDQHKRFPNRSIMISEYGPGADVNVSSTTPKKYDYTQEYQLILHKSYYEQVISRDFVAGMTAWNFADFGSEFRGETIPHVNQKGLVQYNREPKEVYYWYQSVLTKEPFIHIALNDNQPLMMIDEMNRSVSVFSNQKEGVVYLNGERLAMIEFEKGLGVLDVPFKNGNNEIKVVANGNSEVKMIKVHKIDNLKTAKVDRLGINIGSHVNFYDEENDLTFAADRNYSKNLYGYVDGIAYNITKDRNQGIPHNIKSTEKDAIYQTMREGLSEYKVDMADGYYKVTLFFVEPKIKSSVETLFNLTAKIEPTKENLKERSFDIRLNGQLIESNFNLAKEYPDKFGVTVEALLKIKNNQGLRINLDALEGKTVMSGVLIEKTF